MEFICGSAIFIFVCFVVVLVGRAHDAAALGEAVLELTEDAAHPLVVVHVVDERLAEDAPHYLQHRWAEVQPGVHALVGPQERCLQRETVHELELFPHNDARRRFLALLDDEGAVIEAEHVDILAEKPTVPNKVEVRQRRSLARHRYQPRYETRSKLKCTYMGKIFSLLRSCGLV